MRQSDAERRADRGLRRVSPVAEPQLPGDPKRLATQPPPKTTGEPTARESLAARRPFGFRGAAKRVIQAQRAAMAFRRGLYDYVPGESQGFSASLDDPALRAINATCAITCIDYGLDKIRCVENLDNSGLETLLNTPAPAWAACRWINVAGYSWDVVSRLSKYYNIHPLAVEDVLHVPQSTKVDYYDAHAAVYLTVFSVESNGDAGVPQKADLISTYRLPSANYVTTHRDIRGPCTIKLEQAAALLIPKSDDTDDYSGTLITFFQYGGKSVVDPIIARLTSSSKTLVRKSEDISFLLQAIVDVIVDHAFAPLKMYNDQIYELEGLLLQMPRMKYTRELHLIQGELALLKQSLGPVPHLINGLREPKIDRAWISQMTIVYLGDVKDHSETLLANISTLSTLAKNNVDLIFNTFAHNTNQNMRYLAMVSIVFLPITFIAGVYGTNFAEFPELQTAEGKRGLQGWPFHLGTFTASAMRHRLVLLSAYSHGGSAAGIWYFWRLCIVVAALTSVIILWGPMTSWLRRP